MRVALISIDGQPLAPGSQAALLIAGRSIVLRQLDFLVAAGAERVIGIGHGASFDALALRHAAESAGARFQAVPDAHALLGTVGTADDLLVLMPGLLPEATAALEELAGGSCLLTLPDAAVAHGFERIDRDRAWAGVASVPGSMVERLADLPPDSSISAALMRIALQGRVAERKLDPALVTDGSWLVATGDPAALEAAWLARNLPEAAATDLSARTARAVLKPFALSLLRQPRARSLAASGAAALLAVAVGSGLAGWGALSFLLLAAGTLAGAFAVAIAGLQAAPFRTGRSLPLVLRALPRAVDLALLACCALVTGGDWLHRLFPAAVLLLALYLPRHPVAGTWPSLRWLEDRMIAGLLLWMAALAGHAEPAIMLLGLAILAGHMAGQMAGAKDQRG